MKNLNRQHYIPGNCNIGVKELSVRKKFLVLFSILTFFFTTCAFVFPTSIWVWVLLVLCAFSAFVLFYEVRYRFCVIFGFFNLYNFKNLGHLDEVKNVQHQKVDRKKVWEINIFSFMIALLYSTAIHMAASSMQ